MVLGQWASLTACLAPSWPRRAQAIDTDRNNELSFAEFVEFLLTVSIGTRDDKLDFGFRLMDLDKNGVITKVRCVSAPCACVDP